MAREKIYKERKNLPGKGETLRGSNQKYEVSVKRTRKIVKFMQTIKNPPCASP